VDDDRDGASDDVVLLCGPAEHPGGATVLRQRGGALEIGEVRPALDGQPIYGELVRLRRRAEHAHLYDVEVVHDARSGPAQVATRAYRAGWDSAFAGKSEPS
jgi:hypothetical protein